MWWNTARDARGHPIFQKSNGDPQNTGWAGYDCNTPICVQAKEFVLNDATGSVQLYASSNNASTFEAGCPSPTAYTPWNRTRVSDSLCYVLDWWQGIYLESWANGLTTPPISYNSSGRYVRSNFANYIELGSDNWVAGPLVTGEGIYECYNLGSCVAPDTCECPPGWAGGDCSTPLCVFTTVYNNTRGCTHGGVCGYKDTCTCLRQPSLLPQVHPEVLPGATGFTGHDCSIAICTQGYYDSTCMDVPGGNDSVSSGGQGCYRCANGGNCTSPDYCTCPPEWTGYDCRTPVCTQQATPEIVAQLNTVDPAKISAFELDPCGMEFLTPWRNMMVSRGNCTNPDLCTCFCSSRSWRDASGALVVKPWRDTLPFLTIPIGYVYGSYDCLAGWEGYVDTATPDRFKTCHLRIFVPSWIRRNLLYVLIGAAAGLIFLLLCWFIVRRRLRQKYLQAKAERRRSRRSSEEERLNSAGMG